MLVAPSADDAGLPVRVTHLRCDGCVDARAPLVVGRTYLVKHTTRTVRAR